MATTLEIAALDLHWSLVIKTIYPAIDVVVKGDPDSVESLLSVWETGNPAFAKPTEAELLTALGTVLSEVTAQDAVDVVQSGASAQVDAIPSFAFWTEQHGLDWIANHIGPTQIDGITNLAAAKAVMNDQTTAFEALWRMVVAMRNQLWPDKQETE
jgi:hypothetical protein